jgi:D-threo-aldose 1-dehydrogenase
LLEQSALDELLPACTDRGVSVLAASIFNSGVLATPRPASDARFEYRPASEEVLERAHRIADVCEAHGVTLPEAAMAFPPPAPGCRRHRGRHALRRGGTPQPGRVHQAGA